VTSRRQARREAAERAAFVSHVLARLREPEGHTISEVLQRARDAEDASVRRQRHVVRAGHLWGLLG
jgi:hypothetical protein